MRALSRGKSGFVLVALLACGTYDSDQLKEDGGLRSSGNDAGLPPLVDASVDAAPVPPLGAPISAPKGKWTWVDFPDSECDDGTPTGLGVKITDSPNLLVFFYGGGACWDYQSCVVDNTSVHGPFGAAQFAPLAAADPNPSIFGALPANPFKDYNFVFVPYCTSDVHIGDNDATYVGSGKAVTLRHRGHANLRAFLKRIGATWARPEKLVVSGSSAGGLGAIMTYDTVRAYFPASKSYLIDDSGQTLVGNAIPKAMRDAAYANWKMGAALGALCPTCQDDWSAIVPALVQKYPDDRMALLSSANDKTMSGYYKQSETDFALNLLNLTTYRFNPTAHFRYFIPTGEAHTMLMSLPLHIQNGVQVTTFLTQMVTDDPAWKSVRP